MRLAGQVADEAIGNCHCAIIDFELLERTPENEIAVRESRRKSYLAKQARRFESKEPFPPGLAPVVIMAVDYVFGQVESTGGALWVVGKDPVLFEFPFQYR